MVNSKSSYAFGIIAIFVILCSASLTSAATELIYDCRDLNVSGTTYILQNNPPIPCNNYCFNFTADNIMLDLNGSAISCGGIGGHPGDMAIYTNKNGSIITSSDGIANFTDMSEFVWFDGATNGKASNLGTEVGVATGSITDSILITGSENIEISNLFVENNDDSMIHVINSRFISLYGLHSFYGGQAGASGGFFFVNSENIYAENNTISGAGGVYMIELSNASNVAFTTLVLNNITDIGIGILPGLGNSDNISFKNVKIENTDAFLATYAILVQESNNGLFIDVDSVNAFPIQLTDSDNITLLNVTAPDQCTNSQYYKKWHYKAHAKDGKNNKLSGVNIQILNATDSILESMNTINGDVSSTVPEYTYGTGCTFENISIKIKANNAGKIKQKNIFHAETNIDDTFIFTTEKPITGNALLDTVLPPTLAMIITAGGIVSFVALSLYGKRDVRQLAYGMVFLLVALTLAVQIMLL